jgi:hydrogenase nickel incorporation protein HypB
MTTKEKKRNEIRLANQSDISVLDHLPKAELKVIELEASVHETNDQVAAENRAFLEEKGILSLNLISSPGSGKTTLLVETLNLIKDDIRCAVIEGDQQTDNDAQRIAKTGVPVVQINTRQSCHLDASQVRRALEELPLDEIDLLFIENVGNLVCPAGFDLGESETVVIMSITEGEDKPAKYPLAFHIASHLVLTKMDLLPHLRFDLDRCIRYAHQLNPMIKIIQTSAFTHQGLPTWVEALKFRIQQHQSKLLTGDSP